MSADGRVLQSEIIGAVKMKSFLSGMPELKLGLNDKLLFEATGRRAGGRGLSKGKAVEMEDIKFHQCVRLARFENDRTISFIPPGKREREGENEREWDRERERQRDSLPKQMYHLLRSPRCGKSA